MALLLLRLTKALGLSADLVPMRRLRSFGTAVPKPKPQSMLK